MNFALKYRPTSFEDILSQEHLVGENGVFKIFIEQEYFPHTLLFGPAGVGKTTIARVVAKELNRDFFEFNATSFKIEDIRTVIKHYKNTLLKPLIFIDEIHRLSKNQEEVFLPFLENNSCLLLGASTQNPYYSLTQAFRSRIHIFELNRVKKDDLKKLLLDIAIKEDLILEDNAIDYLINSSGGDARAMINLLESASYINKKITKDILVKIRPRTIIAGSIEDSEHYNLISALIKSIRGSDIDAALFYLARLIEAGELPGFIARRLAILASEDIGNANPNALNLASSALNIVEHISYPEAKITLSQLVIYLASCPKSNAAYKAINKAQEIAKKDLLNVPTHLINHSKEYLYPHDFGGYVKQEYLLKKLKIYNSLNIGFEKNLNEWLQKIKEEK